MVQWLTVQNTKLVLPFRQENRLVGGGGELIRAPSIDIAEVGSGGGSIAYLDGAGGLRVGPRSAGAVPGTCLLSTRRCRTDRPPMPM